MTECSFTFSRHYLFRCVDTSESVNTTAYGECHIALPLRDHLGNTAAVMDLTRGQVVSRLLEVEEKDLNTVLRVLTITEVQVASKVSETEFESETSVDSSLLSSKWFTHVLPWTKIKNHLRDSRREEHCLILCYHA